MQFPRCTQEHKWKNLSQTINNHFIEKRNKSEPKGSDLFTIGEPIDNYPNTILPVGDTIGFIMRFAYIWKRRRRVGFRNEISIMFRIQEKTVVLIMANGGRACAIVFGKNFYKRRKGNVSYRICNFRNGKITVFKQFKSDLHARFNQERLRRNAKSVAE